MVLTRLVYPLIIPALILSLALWIRPELYQIQETYLPLLAYLPFALLIASLILCFQFNQLRSLLIALVLAVTYLIIRLYLQLSLEDNSALNIFFLVSVLLPFLIIAISWIPERGIVTFFGGLFLFLISLPILAAIFLFQQPELLSSIVLYFPIRSWSFAILSPLAIAIYLLALGHQLVRLWLYEQPFDAASTILLLTLLVNFILFDQYYISTMMFSATQLILIWGVLKQSHDMAYRDELTGLPGRRALNEALKSPGRKYVLAMMDIDHFKKFNDKYGHDVGDDVLKVVASKMALVTGGGKAYRYGGEEFTVLFKGKELDSCIVHLEAVREDIAGYSLSIREKSKRPKNLKEGIKKRANRRKPKGIHVTISIGVAKKTASLTTPEQVLKAADKSLYKAKTAGRNCLVKNN
ncbi:MAG: GGDEF domain-containing protein [Gammaproteobacteria bacterium]|nr:MAG: GGDEF domain-containing protein [Gammaproteobacteria bacterium]